MKLRKGSNGLFSLLATTFYDPGAVLEANTLFYTKLGAKHLNHEQLPLNCPEASHTLAQHHLGSNDATGPKTILWPKILSLAGHHLVQVKPCLDFRA